MPCFDNIIKSLCFPFFFSLADKAAAASAADDDDDDRQETFEHFVNVFFFFSPTMLFSLFQFSIYKAVFLGNWIAISVIALHCTALPPPLFSFIQISEH